jgi:hypothetical protein
MSDLDDYPEVFIRIPLSPETAKRLEALSDHCHADPVKVAASLLSDILKDDEVYNSESPPPGTRLN